ncbi:MAG TPA: cytidylate kinase-like family protein [Candidatus Ornithomonoglobus intestinigallinarum]|uniref:Cytidylate kinase-like family protein n=1 Tax=Candidatus Ornithomonoglobus intestinigallinarum TaxID=2840894 RepID=A0A9D1H3P9_9FIRM|nr:cytidylate kinase-like family protein [Candidatus Ornithomonoglobus intestinigallinarum]
MSRVITVGRQFGSGGRDVGQKIAAALNIPYYDKELVEKAAEKSNMSSEAVKEIDERATNSLLYSIVTGGFGMKGLNTPLFYEMPMNDKFFIAQSEVIKELAREGDCVVVGRCADYVLENEENVDVFSLFVYAPLEFRTMRVARDLKLTENRAKEHIQKTDKQRRTYYDYYTSRSWGNMTNYDLCINTGKIGIDNAAELIISYLKK